AVPLERGLFLACCHVPKLDQVVVAARGDEPAVGAERDRPDLVGVALANKALLAGGKVPEDEFVVVAAGGQGSAVWTKSEAVDVPAKVVALEDGLDLGRFGGGRRAQERVSDDDRRGESLERFHGALRQRLE